MKPNVDFLVDYKCPRCNFQTKKKTDMYRHLYDRKVVCPGIMSAIELSDEVKKYILANRIYREPPK